MELMVPQALEKLPGRGVDAGGRCVVDLEVWREGRGPFPGRLLARSLAEAAEGSLAEPSAAASAAWRPFLWELQARKVKLAKVQIAGPADREPRRAPAGKMAGRWRLKPEAPPAQVFQR